MPIAEIEMTPADRERTIPVLLEVMPARHLHLIRDDTVGIDKRSLYLAKGRPEQVKKALIKEIPVPVQESLDDVELRARRGSMRYRCVVLNVIQFTDRNDSHATALLNDVVKHELVLMNLARSEACPLKEVCTVELPTANYVLY